MAHKIRIITVGKSHDAKLKDAIADYEKRLRPLSLEWRVLAPKTEASIEDTITSESNAITQNLKQAEYVVLLDERGTQYTSEEFSDLVFAALSRTKDMCIIIGGAYGVSKEVYSRANAVVSLGKMVFPHQLVRLMLVEQLYRAQSIRAGSKYHHGDHK